MMPTTYPNPTTVEDRQAQPAPSRLFPEEATGLLQSLAQQRWQRLSSEYHDPLGMLFGNRARQWTAGWDHQHQHLYLLVWATDSWEEKPVWSFYQDGVLVFQEEAGFSKTRDTLFHQLLEGSQLPFLTQARFLAPLVEFQFNPQQRQKASKALMRTIQARPEIFDTLKEPLLALLEQDLGSDEWPLLDILKLHRVAHKTNLVDLFRQCAEMGLLRTELETQRLDGALKALQAETQTLGQQISTLFLPALQSSEQALKDSLNHGTWRTRLVSRLSA